jgi:hypothetical protein
MKQLFISIYLVLCGMVVSAQSFEGEIVYHNTYKSRTPTVPDKQYGDMMGTIQNYYIKGANYRSESNGSLIIWQLYINKDKKLYTNMAHSPAILWNDVNANTDGVVKSELHKSAATILGYTCDELVLHCKTSVQQYYFSSKLPVDSKLFTAHAFANWYYYLSKANAIPLKTVITNANFTMESVAAQVKPMKLDDGKFTLPGGAKTEKNMF